MDDRFHLFSATAKLLFVKQYGVKLSCNQTALSSFLYGSKSLHHPDEQRDQDAIRIAYLNEMKQKVQG